MSRVLFLAGLAALIVGVASCATEVSLRHPETGRAVVCKPKGTNLRDRQASVDDCAAYYEERGYERFLRW